ncbi:hypothetical protein BJX68DRAFT_260520 [Aspergillus pseudodeflectus]|uniref:Uncharacterized protein n=1 Tax=Aspergillus pseudodeflectus TaxID=176178 RepID=A0ABR4LAZ4_9EURO
MDFHPTSWADLDPDKFDESARRGDSFTRFKAEKRRGALAISILGALIAADLWVQNVSIVPRDKVIDTASLADPITPEERSDAEALKRLGNDATYGHDYPLALSMYSQAIKIDSGNAIYRSNRSAAYCALDQFEEAAQDAYIAVKIDPTYAKAWARLGTAYTKLNRSKKARKCYARAVELAGPDVTETMKRGLAEAEAKIKAALAKVADGDKVTQSRAGKAILDQGWVLTLKTVRFHSLVHEQQVAGLVLFAQQMSWPYIDETGFMASHSLGSSSLGHYICAYSLHAVYQQDTKAFNILGLGSVAASAFVLAHSNSPRPCPWRSSRSQSLNGWIGPCPAVEFMPPVKDAAGPRHIQLKAEVIHSLWFENVFPGAPLPRFGAEDDSFLFADEDITEPGPYDDRRASMCCTISWEIGTGI